MVAYSLEVNKDLFHFKEDNKEQFGLKAPSQCNWGIDVFGKLYKIK